VTTKCCSRQHVARLFCKLAQLSADRRSPNPPDEGHRPTTKHRIAVVVALFLLLAPGLDRPLVGQTPVRAPVPKRLRFELTHQHQQETAAQRGYRILRSKPFLPPDFDQEVFDHLWEVWPKPLRERAKKTSPAERRQWTLSRYGLMEASDHNGRQGPGLGWVHDGQGGWVMNCLACHAGKVAGRVIPGLPNTHLALQTLVEDVRLVKFLQLKRPAHLELVSLKLPLGTTNGTTNSVVFGIVLGALRDADMNVDFTRPSPKLVHHDMDAPPFWNVKKKTSLYIDGHALKTHRPLVQFMLLPSNNGKTVRSWENDFRDILAWIESIRPPVYPWKIDRNLAVEGKTVFRRHCSRCHGTYGSDGVYHQKIVPIDVVGTDPVRLRAVTPRHRRWMRDGWLSRYGKDPVLLDPGGYVAPPLDGIWASAPYFHNGSVPTLWHVLHPDRRPPVWKRTEDGYNCEKVGLEITEYADPPAEVIDRAEQRTYFDTHRRGKSSAGHLFPNALNETEKQAVLEYLKTL